ncbi:retrovirus-related pol polyprotein from transposon TNT 1-94 [Tanacetum coccineum]
MSLPSTWTNVSLIMRNKEGIDDMDINDLYNTLKSYEGDVKGTTVYSSSSLNMASVSEEIISSTDELSIAYHVNSATGQSNKAHGSSSYVDELMYSFFANQSSALQLDHDDLEQVDSDDFEEMYLKWKVAMISTRINKFYKMTGRKLKFDRKEPVGFDKTKVKCFNCHKKGHFARECRGKKNQEYRGNNNGCRRDDAAEEEPTNYALMAITFSKSSSSASFDTEEHPQIALKDKGIANSGCSRHMTGTKEYLSDYQEIKGGFVAFGEGKGRITGKGNIKTDKLDFDDVYYVNGLKFNLFSVSQMCDKKNSVLFTETECLVLSPNFKLLDESQVGNLVRGLPSKHFENDHSCVACQKGKQHKATLTNGFSRFSWVFFMATKDETSGILKKFITEIENQVNHKVKVIRCDNGTEFKNKEMNDFCANKGIRREFSNARTPQQNGVAKRKNRTLIEAARTMLADSLLPVIFWAEAVNTACYVLNRVLVTKTQNKTPYELINGRTPLLSFMRPFGCPVTILNTLDPLGKFEGKADEGFLVGYSIHSKAFRVYNTRTRHVEENLHVTFLENKPNMQGEGPEWLFDLDYLTNSMNYKPVVAENRANNTAGSKEANDSAGLKTTVDAEHAKEDTTSDQPFVLLPLWPSNSLFSSKSSADKEVIDAGKKTVQEPASENDQVFLDELARLQNQEKEACDVVDVIRRAFKQKCYDQGGCPISSSTKTFSVVHTPVNTVDDEIPGLDFQDDMVEGVVVDNNNMDTSNVVSSIPTTRVHSFHPKTQIIGDPSSAVQTRSKVKTCTEEHAFVSYIQKQQRTNHKDFQHYLFACFLSQIESKKISEALDDKS